MSEKIKIKCQRCGAVLAINKQPGIERAMVTCPVCKNKQPFSAYAPVVQRSAAEEESTQYGGSMSNLAFQKQWLLRILPTDKTFSLKQGDNIVGRKADASQASIQIETNGSKRMSREHIVINVGSLTTVKLFKERVNATAVNGKPLLAGDCLILNPGDTIELPDCKLRFEEDDDEATRLT